MSVQQLPSETDEESTADDAISIPLYLAGLSVSLLGIMAVNSSISDTQIGTTTIVLTLLGFVFSIGCRWLQIKPRVVETFMFCVCLFFLFRFLTHSIDLQFFVPPDVSQPDLVIAVALVWLTVLRSWILTNDDSVIFTAVTSVAMIGLVGASDLNAEMLVYFFGYIICATFLLLHQTYLTQRSWSLNGSTKSNESGIVSLQAVMALVSGIVAIMLATVLVVPLRAVGAHLSLASALKNFIGTQHAGANGNSGSTVTLSDDPTFRVGTGSGFSASDQIVLHVFPNDHSQHYYRGRTYDTYDGNGWSSSVQANEVELNPDINHTYNPPESRFRLQAPGQPGGDGSEIGLNPNHSLPYRFTRFVLDSAVTDMLYLPYGTTTVTVASADNVEVSQGEDNCITLNSTVQGGFGYDAFSYDPILSNRLDLRRAPPASTSCPRVMRQQYVDQRDADFVSESDQERLETTASQIVDQLPITHRTDYDKAEAIRKWVSSRCLYSLDVGAVPAGEDAVSYFLFDSKKGYCDLFASSMAILCRYAGIPARVATGFGTGTLNDQGGYDLRVRDKHAWVEVWFSGFGWQIFDPTEGSVQDTSSPSSRFSATWMTGWVMDLLARIRLFFVINGELPAIIAVCILVGLGYVFKIEVLDKRLKSRAARNDRKLHNSLESAKKESLEAAADYSKNLARARYSRFEGIMRRAGLRKESSETPAEYLSAVLDKLREASINDLPNADALRDSAGQLTEDVMIASYAPIDLVGQTLVDREQSGIGAASLQIFEKNAGSIRKALKKTIKLTGVQ
jgi:transglutaminase-like putative cysteine protease